MAAAPHEFLRSPLDSVQSLFVSNGQGLPAHSAAWGEQALADQLFSSEDLSHVPLLNSTPLDSIPPNSLVRYRCMVVDMFDPEMYSGFYQLMDTSSGQVSWRSAKYMDAMMVPPGHEIVSQHSSGEQPVIADRTPLLCIPVPGETGWASAAVHKSCTFSAPTGQEESMADGGSAPGAGKMNRKRGQDEDYIEDGMEEGEDGGAAAGGSKRQGVQSNTGSISLGEEGSSSEMECVGDESAKANEKQATAGAAAETLTHPLHDMSQQGPACIVKMYSTASETEASPAKIGDVLEVIGVLSTNPTLTQFHFEDGMDVNPTESIPYSAVPRLHAMSHRMLSTTNPLVPLAMDAESTTSAHQQASSQVSSMLEGMKGQLPHCRQTVVTALRAAVAGDELASEYLLFNLLSSVHGRKKGQTSSEIGKFSLGLSTRAPPTGAAAGAATAPLKGPDSDSTWLPAAIAPTLHELMPAAVVVNLDVEGLNKHHTLYPQKDHTLNRLRPGLLQLAQGTILVVDETRMQPGQLGEKGIKNLSALQSVVGHQVVPFDFQFYEQPFPTDTPALILSEGKSMLQAITCRVEICPEQDPLSAQQHCASLFASLDAATLSLCRQYLTLARLGEYRIPEEVSKQVEQYFVHARQTQPAGTVTGQTLEYWLELARLLCLSHGETELSVERWQQVHSMEAARTARLQ